MWIRVVSLSRMFRVGSPAAVGRASAMHVFGDMRNERRLKTGYNGGHLPGPMIYQVVPGTPTAALMSSRLEKRGNFAPSGSSFSSSSMIETSSSPAPACTRSKSSG